jgi:hypothetical protein
MAAVPPRSLTGFNKRVAQTLKGENEKVNYNVAKFSILYLFIIEILSMKLMYLPKYLLFWYPLLTQFGYALLIYTLFTFSKKLGFCRFKKTGLLLFFAYYLIGCFGIIFELGDKNYYQIISFVFLGMSILTLIYSLKSFKNE